MGICYSIRATRTHGLEVYELVITQGSRVVHSSTHMSQAGAVTRLMTWKKGVRS